MLAAIAIAIALPLWRAVRRGGADGTPAHRRGSVGVAVDPVCGMTVIVGAAAATASIRDETVHFCSKTCADAFDRDQSVTEIASE
jgi:xanthine dehydrogenase accessory factor